MDMNKTVFLFTFVFACLLMGCGEKETVIRFRTTAYNGFRPEVQVGLTVWQATMDSIRGTGEVTIPVEHPVLATVRFGKFDKRIVYMEPGKEMDIIYNCGRDKKGFAVEGDLKAENDFILKPGFYLPLTKQFFKVPVAVSMQYADSVMQINRQRLENAPLSEAFKELQLAQLQLRTGEWLNRIFFITDTANYIKAMQQYMPQDESWMEIPGYCDFMKNAVRSLGKLMYNGGDADREANAIRYVLENIQEPSIKVYLLDLNIMPLLTVNGVEGNEKYVDIYRQYITDTVRLGDLDKVIAMYKKTAAGAPCPDFCLQDINGKEVCLGDFAGKYVYIDLWATWCGPCKGEMPSLALLEEKFAGEDIVFVSISVDRNKDIALWKKTVADMKLGGVQLHLGEDWDWVKNFMPTGLAVPRFILLDREGKIINANMTRPSDKVTGQKFEEILKK